MGKYYEEDEQLPPPFRMAVIFILFVTKQNVLIINEGQNQIRWQPGLPVCGKRGKNGRIFWLYSPNGTDKEISYNKQKTRKHCVFRLFAVVWVRGFEPPAS